MARIRAHLIQPSLRLRCSLQGCERPAVAQLLVNGKQLCQRHMNLFAVGRQRAEAEQERREQLQRPSYDILEELEAEPKGTLFSFHKKRDEK